jgi:gamma-glutamyl phosphate reductase
MHDESLAKQARQAALQLQQLSGDERDLLLKHIYNELDSNQQQIIEANRIDLEVFILFIYNMHVVLT